MWKVESPSGRRLFHTEEEATAFFRKFIATKVGDQISHITEQIDAYTNRYYPDGAPANFAKLKAALTRLATDSDCKREDLDLEDLDFEDDNIRFSALLPYNSINAYVNSEEAKGQFPEIEINIFGNCFEEERFFYISDGDWWMINVTLAETEEEPETDW